MSRAAFTLFLLLALPAYAASVININTADQAVLETLKGIGPTKAKAIIEYRTVHGTFVRIEDIELVTGIGPKTFADIKAFISVDRVAEPAPAPPVVKPPAQTTRAPAPVPKKPEPVAVESPVQKSQPIQTAAIADAANESSHSALWFSLLGLTGLLGGGVAGVRYLRPRPMSQETLPTADEFEIE